MKAIIVLAALAACQPKPTQPTQPTQPTATPEAQLPARCVGQNVDPVALTAPSEGPMPLQLAPGFLDRMPTCTQAAATIPADQISAEGGKVNAKGDCAWPNGVSCHFHLGVEFVASGTTPRPKLHELHCVFPTPSSPKAPQVYGTHFTCKPGTAAPAAAPAHQIHEGAACGARLLPALAAMTPSCDARCCEDGTLTSPTPDREKAGTLDVRPDFRICAMTEALDCSALVAMTGHAANAPVYGPPVEE